MGSNEFGIGNLILALALPFINWEAVGLPYKMGIMTPQSSFVQQICTECLVAARLCSKLCGYMI